MELNNKQTLKTLREFIDKALQQHVIGHNRIIMSSIYDFELGSCTYERDGSNATFKLNVK